MSTQESPRRNAGVVRQDVFPFADAKNGVCAAPARTQELRHG